MRGAGKRRYGLPTRRMDHTTAYLMILPSFAFLVVFVLVPLFMAVEKSFTSLALMIRDSASSTPNPCRTESLLNPLTIWYPSGFSLSRMGPRSPNSVMEDRSARRSGMKFVEKVSSVRSIRLSGIS